MDHARERSNRAENALHASANRGKNRDNFSIGTCWSPSLLALWFPYSFFTSKKDDKKSFFGTK